MQVVVLRRDTQWKSVQCIHKYVECIHKYVQCIHKNVHTLCIQGICMYRADIKAILGVFVN